jgi:hypothetical protein
MWMQQQQQPGRSASNPSLALHDPQVWVCGSFSMLVDNGNQELFCMPCGGALKFYGVIFFFCAFMQSKAQCCPKSVTCAWATVW